MSHKPRSGLIISLGAAAGAFGIATMISTATAPSAHADDYSDIVSAVEADFAAGQADFTTAEADFGSVGQHRARYGASALE
jgi:hypothetical protein